jgi:inner membrane protein
MTDDHQPPHLYSPPSPFQGFVARSRVGARSVVKLAALVILVLLLMIPIAMVLDLVRERRAYQSTVTHEIGRIWGGSQTVGAVVVSLPVRVQVAPEVWRLQTLRVLPTQVHWNGTLGTELRSRGIYDVPVYEARLEATGRIDAPDFDALGVDPETVEWERASAAVVLSDLAALQETPTLTWGGRDLALDAGTEEIGGLSIQHLEARLGPDARETITGGADFAVGLVLRGTERLAFLPWGQMTTARVVSPWPEPSFDGAFLPRTPEVGDDGFEAAWSVPHYGRGYPGSWIETRAISGDRTVIDGATVSERRSWMRDIEAAEAPAVSSVMGSDFGLTLVRTADQYQKTERAVKYGALFIVLTFGALFLLELLSSVRLYAPHYLLVGCALCLFYVLLLALAEHVGFLPAYGVATVGIVAMITLYARSLLGSWRRVAPLAGALSLLYLYLLSLLGAEDYSLLLGAGGLFVVLAAAMYLTRKLDWRTLSFGEGAGGEEEGDLPLETVS